MARKPRNYIDSYWPIYILWTLLVALLLGLFIWAIVDYYGKTPTQSIDPLVIKNLTVENSTVLNGMISIHGDVICETPMWPSCVDISGEVCTTPIQASCIPQDLNVNSINVVDLIAHNFTHVNMVEMNETLIVTDDLIVKNTMTCPNGPGTIANSCLPTAVTLDGITCTTQGALDPNCLPNPLILDSAVIGSLTTQNHTVEQINTIITNVTTLNSDITNLNVLNSMTCAIPNLIDQLCFDISGKTCTTPLDENCVSNADISGKSCTIPINADCVDISGETCTAPITPSCIPGKDAQMVSAVNEVEISDILYVPMTDMTLTASFVGSGTRTYEVSFSNTHTQSAANGALIFSLSLNGVYDENVGQTTQLVSGKESIVTTVTLLFNVVNGDVINLIWKKTGSGSIFVTTRRFIIKEL